MRFPPSIAILFFLQFPTTAFPAAFENIRTKVRSNSICGETGSVSERIKDCRHSVTVKGLNKQSYKWDVVTQTRTTIIFRDRVTKQIWTPYNPQRLGFTESLTLCKSPEEGIPQKGQLPIDFNLPTEEAFREAKAHGLPIILEKMSRHMGLSFNLKDLDFWTLDSIKTDDNKLKIIVYGPSWTSDNFKISPLTRDSFALCVAGTP